MGLSRVAFNGSQYIVEPQCVIESVLAFLPKKCYTQDPLLIAKNTFTNISLQSTLLNILKPNFHSAGQV